MLAFTPQDRSKGVGSATLLRFASVLQTRCAMSRPPSWLRGVDEVGCLDFLQTVPWGATPEKMTEYAEWLVTNGADSLDAIAALDPASFAGSPLLAMHIPVMIRTAVKAVAARDGVSSSGAVAAAGGGGDGNNGCDS